MDELQIRLLATIVTISILLFALKHIGHLFLTDLDRLQMTLNRNPSSGKAILLGLTVMVLWASWVGSVLWFAWSFV